MKSILLLLMLFLFSCQSKKDDNLHNKIEAAIRQHNLKTRIRYERDSSLYERKYKMELAGYIPEEKIEREVHSYMNGVYRYNWNNPYRIENDRDLTLEKYLDYCRVKGLDTATFYKVFDQFVD